MVSLQVQVKAEVSSSSMASRTREEQKRSRELGRLAWQTEETMINGPTP